MVCIRCKQTACFSAPHCLRLYRECKVIRALCSRGCCWLCFWQAPMHTAMHRPGRSGRCCFGTRMHRGRPQHSLSGLRNQDKAIECVGYTGCKYVVPQWHRAAPAACLSGSQHTSRSSRTAQTYMHGCTALGSVWGLVNLIFSMCATWHEHLTLNVCICRSQTLSTCCSIPAYTHTWPQWAVLDWNHEASRQAPVHCVWPARRSIAT